MGHKLSKISSFLRPMLKVLFRMLFYALESMSFDSGDDPSDDYPKETGSKFTKNKQVIPCLDYLLYDSSKMPSHWALKYFAYVYEASFGYYVDNKACSRYCPGFTDVHFPP